MSGKLNDVQVEALKKENVTNKGIKYLEQVLDFKKVEVINRLSFLMIYILVTAVLLAYSMIFKNEVFENIALLMTMFSPVIILVVCLLKVDKLKKDSKIEATEENINDILSYITKRKKVALINRLLMIISFGMSFIGLMTLGTFWEMIIFAVLLFTIGSYLHSVVINNRKLIIESINEQGEIIRL